jgi:hypothetical protein
MIRRDVSWLNLNQPSDQKVYVAALNAIQDELCNLVELEETKVTTSSTQPWNQFTDLSKRLRPNSKFLTFQMTKEENENLKNSVIRLESISIDNQKTKAVSFLLDACVAYIEDTEQLIFTQRCYFIYSHLLNQWYFSTSNNFDNSTFERTVHYSALEISPYGILPHYGRITYEVDNEISFHKGMVTYHPVGKHIKDTAFFFDDSGHLCIAISPPDDYYIKSISISDWKLIL